MHFVYVITNIINNKVYIGQTNNPLLRWSQHKSNAKHNRSNQNITKAIIKYGVNNFKFNIIASALNQNDVDFIEEQIIIQYDSRNPNCGYNIAIGGSVVPHTSEVCKKISDGLKRFYTYNVSSIKGRELSKEWKDKLSKSASGKLGPNHGKKFSDIWKDNISKSLKGKSLSIEHRNLISKNSRRKSPPNRKFTFEIAEEIRKEYSNGGITQKQLGIKYGLSQGCIFNIIKHNTYKT